MSASVQAEARLKALTERLVRNQIAPFIDDAISQGKDVATSFENVEGDRLAPAQLGKLKAQAAYVTTAGELCNYIRHQHSKEEGRKRRPWSTLNNANKQLVHALEEGITVVRDMVPRLVEEVIGSVPASEAPAISALTKSKTYQAKLIMQLEQHFVAAFCAYYRPDRRGGEV